jgi:hypothetical protein
MSNYTITTNFAAKDGLASGNPGKLVLGVQFTTEFNNIATAIATKFDGSVVFAPDGNAAQPSFGFTNNAGTGMFNAAGVVGLATNSLSRLTVSTAGAVVVNAPTSGSALTVNTLTGTNGAIVTGGGSSVLQVTSSSALADVSLHFDVPTQDAFYIGSNNSGSTNGIGAPPGCDYFFTNQARPIILGTSSTARLTIGPGVQAGAPTGGDKGAGTINATGLFVNGTAVSTGATATLVAVKAAVTARSLTTTPANDPDLTIAIPGAGTYAIEAFISHYNATPSFGISCNLNYSGTYTANSSLVDYATNGVPTAATNLIASAVATSQLAGNTGSALGIFAPLLITATLVATGAGTVAFSWAQSSSNASATNVGAGSYMTATKIA